MLALEDNRPELRQHVADNFALAELVARSRTVEKGRGRIEVRTCRTIADPAVLAWIDPDRARPKLGCLAEVAGERRTGETAAAHTRYYLSCLPGEARALAAAARGHWGIEHRLRWVLDVAFREDAGRARVDHAAANLAVIRKLALNLLSSDPTRRIGVNGSRHKAAWDDAYLLHVLGAQ